MGQPRKIDDKLFGQVLNKRSPKRSGNATRAQTQSLGIVLAPKEPKAWCPGPRAQRSRAPDSEAGSQDPAAEPRPSDPASHP